MFKISVYKILKQYFCKKLLMKRAATYFVLGTGISFFLNYYLLGSQGWELDLYYGVSFGLAWSVAYFLDDERFKLSHKFLLSFTAMILLMVLGSIIFNLEKAIPSVIKFSAVFVAYYLIASFRTSKSLRK